MYIMFYLLMTLYDNIDLTACYLAEGQTSSMHIVWSLYCTLPHYIEFVLLGDTNLWCKYPLCKCYYAGFCRICKCVINMFCNITFRYWLVLILTIMFTDLSLLHHSKKIGDNYSSLYRICDIKWNLSRPFTARPLLNTVAGQDVWNFRDWPKIYKI